MASTFFVVFLAIGCAADVPHGGSGSTDALLQHGCRESECHSDSLHHEVADKEAMLSLLQTQVKRSISIEHRLDEDKTKNAPLDTQSMQTAVLVHDKDDIAQQVVMPLEEDRAFSESNSTVTAEVLEHCEAKLIRFNSLSNQSLGDPPELDPYFPPNLTSIAASGTSCGDKAQEIQESCGKFDNWKTFQEVAGELGVTFKVVGPSGITFDDIRQGALGNCYFLTALAAVAYNRPEIIDAMFVERDLWDENIFKTQWLLNGKKSTLVVDSMIPAGETDTYFTHPSASGEFWAVILAKTWAKMYSSFKSIEGGDAAAVIKAMTQAPGQYINMLSLTEDSLWQILMDAATNKYPMSAGTCGSCSSPRKYKLAQGHAYAVLEAYVSSDYGKVVKLYNPWHHDCYVGAVPNNEKVNGPKEGVFTMKLEEFYSAYEAITVNYVQSDYKLTIKTIATGRMNSEEVIVSSPGKFWVAMHWPTWRMVQPCPFLNPTCSIRGHLTTAKGQQVGTMLSRMADDNDIVAVFENEAGGTYNILAEAIFRESATWLENVSFTVYAPAAAQINDTSKGSQAVELEMFGPVKDGEACEVITLPQTGVFLLNKAKPSPHDVPTYWRLDNSSFLFYALEKDQWWLVGEQYYPQIKAGELWHTHMYNKTALQCGCQDLATGVPGFSVAIPCEQVTNDNYLYSNVKCTEAQYSSYVQRYCPKTCGVCPSYSWFA